MCVCHPLDERRDENYPVTLVPNVPISAWDWHNMNREQRYNHNDKKRRRKIRRGRSSRRRRRRRKRIEEEEEEEEAGEDGEEEDGEDEESAKNKALVAPKRLKSKSIKERQPDGPTDGLTDRQILF